MTAADCVSNITFSCYLVLCRLAKPGSAIVDRKPELTNTVDQGLVHRALFKTLSKDDPPSRPVKFTVKI